MAENKNKHQIQFKRDTSSNLSSYTPASGEPVFSTDTNDLKIGDGSTSWSGLSSMSGGGGSTGSYTVAEISTDATTPKHDWNVEGASANFLKVTPASNINITGIVSTYTYKRFTLLNDSNTFTIQLTPQAGGSTAGNKLRFSEGVGGILYPKEKVDFVYDNIDSEWLVLKHGVTSNTRAITSVYGSAVVSGVYNIVIVDSGTYSHLQSNNLTDPNTVYFVP